MVTLQLSIFVLDEAVPMLFDEDGKQIHLTLSGRDPKNGQNEVYAANLVDGSYYLVNHECDENTGMPVACTLECVTVLEGAMEHESLERVTRHDLLSFSRELEVQNLAFHGVPERAVEQLLAPMPEHFSSW